MFRCSYTIIRERINSCVIKLQLLNSPLKYIGVYVCMYVFIYRCVCVCLRINALPDDGVTAPKHVRAVLM
jgi:hypothetical protein